MTTVANTRALANTARRALNGMAPKYRGRVHANLAWQVRFFMAADTAAMNEGYRWGSDSKRVYRLVGGVYMYTWVQDHLKGVVPQPVLIPELLQGTP